MKWLILFMVVTNTCFSQQFPVTGYKINKFVRKPGIVIVADSSITVIYQVDDSMARQFTIKINRTFHNDLFQMGGINGYLCDSGLVIISHKIIYVSREKETIQFLRSKYWNPDQWRKKFHVIPERDYFVVKREIKNRE